MTFRSCLSPSIQVCLPRVNSSVSKRNGSALHFNEKAYAFLCCSGVETENLDLFEKSHVNNVWQYELKGFKD